MIGDKINYRKFKVSDAVSAMEVIMKEYGWTINELKLLSIPQFVVLLKYLNRRLVQSMPKGANNIKKGMGNLPRVSNMMGGRR